MYTNIPEEELEKAITYLINNIPYTTFQRIDIQKPDWYLDQHFGLGMEALNGMMWHVLFEKAARKMNESSWFRRVSCI